jgi:hypothetical protein
MSEDVVEPIEEVESKLDKVKGVVKRNWKPFAIGVGTISIIVVTCYVTRGRKVLVLSKASPGDVIAHNMNTMFGPFFSKQNFTTVHYTGAPGNPGIMNYWVEGRQVFPSFKSASVATDIPQYMISESVRGIRPDAMGQHFVRITP